MHGSEHLSDPVAQQHSSAVASPLEQVAGEVLVGDRATVDGRNVLQNWPDCSDPGGDGFFPWQVYCDHVPKDAEPQMTALYNSKKSARVAAAPPPLRVCPRCYTELPTSGRCDYCE